MLDYIRAMLKHSSCDRFVFLSCREQHRFSLAESEEGRNSPRDVRILHPTQIASLRDLEGAVFVTSNERLGPILRLRQGLCGPIWCEGVGGGALSTFFVP